MKFRAMFFAGAAVGYVVGTRAGRERYEQIMQASRRFSEDPRVQEAAGVVRAKGEEIAGAARDRVPEQIGNRMPGGRHHGEAPPREYRDPRQETIATERTQI